MKSRRAKLFKVIALTALGVAVFLFSLYRQFPYERIARMAEDRLSSEGVRARIVGLGPGGLLGLFAERVEITEVDKVPLNVTVSELTASPVIATLFSGEPSFSLGGMIFGGEVSMMANPYTKDAEVTFREISLSRAADSIEIEGLPPVSGSVSGRATLISGDNGLDGELLADIASVNVGPGKAFILDLPAIDLGMGRIRAKASGKRLAIESCDLSGGEIEVSVKGNGNVNRMLSRSAVDLDITVNSASSAAERKLPLIFAMLSQYKMPDGSYGIKLKGPVTSLRPRNR
ncbi:MAG: type II secretion system protein GspN [Deltaproteobacteria bacterium]|nr:MAG: type II secretion system protein GspN [Deltaproteobacteria bacterium]